MPAKNAIKQYVEYSYYHIYNRGVNKRVIFLDDRDYRVFLRILKRYLSKDVSYDNSGRVYEQYFEHLDLLCFCLMPNHYHLFVYQKDDADAVKHFMQKLSVVYTAYFNKRYKRVGGVVPGAI